MPLDTIENPCVSYLNNLIEFNAQSEWQTYVDSIKDDFKRRYIQEAMSLVVETFTETKPDQEYHHTLYSYDQSGSLVRTVPPQGVQIITNTLDLATVKQERSNNTEHALKTVFADHSMATTYTYNTLNQLKKQRTPDGGISEFWYDHLSRLVLSQDADQASLNEFSYTLYDGLGRVEEVGQMQGPSSILIASTLEDQTSFESWVYSGAITELTRTFYDEETYVNPLSGEPNELRNRITHVTYTETYNPLTPDDYDYATHYQYDIHGNVSSMVQDYVELVYLDQRYKRIDYSYDLISGNVNQVVYQKDAADQFIHRYRYDADNRITHAETSSDGFLWEKDAKYFYYDHGPLARTENR